MVQQSVNPQFKIIFFHFDSIFPFTGDGWYPEVPAATQCDQCFKVFTNRNAYTNHLPSHQGKTICKHCGKFFSSPSNLNKHIRKNHIFSTHMESQESVNKFS